jgi:hypothetical protein
MQWDMVRDQWNRGHMVSDLFQAGQVGYGVCIIAWLRGREVPHPGRCAWDPAPLDRDDRVSRSK